MIEGGGRRGGLNKEKILEEGDRAGPRAGGRELATREVTNLIFEPGFSTAETVTKLWRGVGMDVVRRRRRAAGGIEVESCRTGDDDADPPAADAGDHRPRVSGVHEGGCPT